MVKPSIAAATTLTSRPSVTTEKAASVMPKPAASPAVMRPRGIGRPAVRVISASMSASYAHIERAGGAGADRDAEQRGQPDHRMHMAGRDQEPDQRREHHERHHPRFHQFDVIADPGDAGLDAGDGQAHRISGSVSY